MLSLKKFSVLFPSQDLLSLMEVLKDQNASFSTSMKMKMETASTVLLSVIDATSMDV